MTIPCKFMMFVGLLTRVESTQSFGFLVHGAFHPDFRPRQHEPESYFSTRNVEAQPIMLRLGLENTPVGLKTGRVKNAATPFSRNYRGCCQSPRAMGNGLGWLPVCLTTVKRSGSSERDDDSSAVNPKGFAVATRLNLRDYQFKQIN